MIDIVFQLIAFFVFALNFEPVPIDPGINPPEWGGDSGGEPWNPDDLLFQVSASGLVNGPDGVSFRRSDVQGRQKMQEMLEILSARSAENTRGESAEGERPKGGAVVIRADRDADFDDVEWLIQNCREAGLSAVRLQLSEPQP